MAKQGISIREAARRLTEAGYDISEGGIRKWIKNGLFQVNDDGSIDPKTLKAQANYARQNVSPIHGGPRVKGQIGGSHRPTPPEDEPLALAKGPVNFEKIRTAREAVNMERDRLKLGRETAELVETATVRRALGDLGALTVEIYDRIPDKLPFPLTPDQRIALRKVIRDSHAELADEAARLNRKMVAAA